MADFVARIRVSIDAPRFDATNIRTSIIIILNLIKETYHALFTTSPRTDHLFIQSKGNRIRIYILYCTIHKKNYYFVANVDRLALGSRRAELKEEETHIENNSIRK